MLSSRKRVLSSAPTDGSNPRLKGAYSSGGTQKHEKSESINRRSSRISFLSIATISVAVAASYLVLNRQESVSSVWTATKVIPRHRFVTVVIPSVVNHPRRHRRVEAIADTWAETARALIVVHNLTQEYPTASQEIIWNEKQEPVDKNRYPQVLHLPQNITMQDDDGFKRLEYVIRHVYYQQKAEFIFLVNDHSYVIPEHLCHYLKPFEPDVDLYSGHAMRNPSVVFNTGAAGYLMSRETMKRLLKVWDEGKQCQAELSFHRSNPDLVVSGCLQDVLHVPAVDTRESGTYHRFHTYGLVRTVMGKVDDWFVNVHDRFQNIPGFDESYRKLLSGADCCAGDSSSFHYVEYAETRALFEIRQLLLQDPEMTDSQLRKLLEQKWPRSDLGGYSLALPLSDADTMKNFMVVIRKMSRTDLEVHC